MFGINTKNIGNKGESLAEQYLLDKGYKILDRNVYMRKAELDIIAKDGDTLVFVEVKTRNNFSFGNPLESMTKDKIDNIIYAAKMYIASKNLYGINARFDFIAVSGTEIEHIKDAFWIN